MDTHGKRFESRMETSLPVHRNTPSIPLPSGLSAPPPPARFAHKGGCLLWPWRDERFFAPWQVIRVAPFKLEAYLTARGEAVILSELYWVWLPGVVLMLVLIGWRVWRRGAVVVGLEWAVGYILAEQRNQKLDTHLFCSGYVKFCPEKWVS